MKKSLFLVIFLIFMGSQVNLQAQCNVVEVGRNVCNEDSYPSNFVNYNGRA